MRWFAIPFGFLGVLCSLGCGSTTTYVKSDTALGRVVVYRNGVAYFERNAHVDEDTLHIAVPGDKIDDFLKSLTVVDARTGEPTPVSYPTNRVYGDQLAQMEIKLGGPAPHDVKLTYVTEAPSWKSSYRIVLGDKGKVTLQAWAIIDNTSGEDWQNVQLGVGSSSALSFRFDLQSVRMVQRDTLQSDSLFAMAPPTGGATYGNEGGQRVLGELSDSTLQQAQAMQNQNKDYRGEEAISDKKMSGSAGPPPAPPPPVVQAARVSAAESIVTIGGASAGGAKRNAPAATRSAGGAGSGGGRSFQSAADSAPAAAPKPAAQRPMVQQQQALPQTANVMPQQPPPDAAAMQLDGLAARLRNVSTPVVIEGYAGDSDGDKFAASLDRANKMRDELVRRGIAANRVVAVGNGLKAGRGAGVRVVEADQKAEKKPGGAATPSAESLQPIGASHFESALPMTVPRGGSAMVSVLKTQTDGEVVYYYDPDSPRGNVQYPFKAVRLQNPTDSVLESGPVTVFGEGRFIGEGMCEPIPAKSTAFVPFALDRQIVIERAATERDEISRILTVQRGVFSTEVQHIRQTKLILRSRMGDTASVYMRHVIPEGYKLTRSPKSEERLAGAPLFKIDVPANGSVEVVLEVATPIFRSTDIRSSTGMEMVRAFLSSGAHSNGPLRARFDELVKLQQDMGNVEQKITTTKEAIAEYRSRMDELHAQLVTLKAVKTAGPLMKSLEQKLDEVSDRLQKATVDLVGLQEKLMVTRIKLQDGVAELSLDTSEAATPKTL
jgi:outer membrane protein OmpA-like peptidoglycan-associated protein